MSEVPGPGSYSVLPALGLNTSRAVSARSCRKQVGILVRMKLFGAINEQFSAKHVLLTIQCIYILAAVFKSKGPL